VGENDCFGKSNRQGTPRTCKRNRKKGQKQRAAKSQGQRTGLGERLVVDGIKKASGQ